MDSFFGGSKSSLHETVKAQQDRLAKYEKKLGDLVKAYKILQEEKKALQDTVNAFSAHPPEITGEANTSEGENSGQENNLRQQVSALTKTLTSLNETKNTLESRFQHDKKELLDQIENLKNSLSAEHTVSQRERAEHETQLKEMKCKLRNEQHEREQEQTHHVAMLRELQHMLAAERNSNQKLELELDDTRSSQNFERQRSLFEEKIRLLNDEKTYLSKELEKTRIKLKQPSRDFLLLEKEVVELRAARVELETLKSEKENSAHQQLHLQSSADQTRIRDLENRLTDLSELIADYDATQKRDQEEILRLQKRVSSLESESSTEKRRSVSVSVNTNIVVSDFPTSPTSPTSPTTPTSPASYSTDLRPAPLQLVTKNREAEISKLKNDMTTFKLEIRKLQDEKKLQQLNLISLTEQHKCQLSEIAEQHTREMAELDKGQSTRLNELLESSTKARLRSQELIAERDEEIAELKKQIHAKERPAVKDGNLMGELLSNVETENVPRTLIFYKQQHKFLLEELTKLKQTRETLEQSLREKERNEHVNMRELTKLKQETTRLIRNTTRESANLEYLKNIVLRYLRATSSSEKRQILLAIFTVLEFSDDERSSVKHKLVPGWFS